MKLLEKLTELKYKQIDENCWKGQGSDGKSDVLICLLENNHVELVKRPHEEDIPATIVTFNHQCEALLEMLERWTWF